MEVTFTNVMITISGVESPEEAYDRLTTALGKIEREGRIDVVWETDKFIVDHDPDSVQETTELWPGDEPRASQPLGD